MTNIDWPWIRILYIGIGIPRLREGQFGCLKQTSRLYCLTCPHSVGTMEKWAMLLAFQAALLLCPGKASFVSSGALAVLSEEKMTFQTEFGAIEMAFYPKVRQTPCQRSHAAPSKTSQ